MIRKLTLYLFFLIASMPAFAQTEALCVQTLRLAQSKYESGRLHELPDILKGCLSSGFTKEERRQAYKLLVQSYIYLEEPEKADEAMLNLLKTDHFFKPNEEVDPAEFVSLYERFRTKPLFRIGVTLGPSISGPLALLDYSGTSDADGTAKYTPQVTFFGGLVWEKDFLDGRLTLAPEAVFAVKRFRDNEIAFLPDDPSTPEQSNIEMVVKTSWIEINPLAKVWLSKEPYERDGKIEPYIIAGPGFNFVTKGTFETPKLNHTNGAGANTGATIDATESFKTVNFSAILGAGFRWRLGEVFIIPDIRIHYGLSNIIDPKDRSIDEALFDYGYVANDMKVNSITINIGIQYAWFSPKKQIK